MYSTYEHFGNFRGKYQVFIGSLMTTTSMHRSAPSRTTSIGVKIAAEAGDQALCESPGMVLALASIFPVLEAHAARQKPAFEVICGASKLAGVPGPVQPAAFDDETYTKRQ